MAITQQRREQRTADESVRTAVATGVREARGGWISMAFSGVAVLGSCVSVYFSTLQAAQLEVYLPPVFAYYMDGEGENFTIPISLANGGARSGTVVSMELEVHNPKTKVTHRFYSAYLGEHPQMQRTTNTRQFVPMTILGNAVHSDTVRFYPVTPPPPEARQDPSKRLVQGEGDYTFRLKINTAVPPDPSLLDRIQGRTQPAPVSVQMTLPVLDHRGLMQMRSKDWFATVASSR
ncbi:MAG TPA: hypothetical protein VG758_08980 [Hyphomicrobiaceae bacterium]|jgi:hypothetical protein|nr:hypothetical protein [Hyphomicrobiaceae bacterium]